MRIVQMILLVMLTASPVPGDDAVRLTFDPTNDTLPSWSPDGATIAYEGNFDIYTIPATGGTPNLIYSSPHWDGGPEWSPDSSTIVFFTTHFSELMKVPATGGTATRFTYNDYLDISPTWSSDDTKIAFHGTYAKKGTHGMQYDNYIYWIPADDGYANPQPIVYGDDNTTPEWAPNNSNKITFTRDSIDIWTKVIGEGGYNVTNDPSTSDYHSTWSPGGQYLAYGSDRSGNMDIWIIPATGGTPIQVTDDPATDAVPAWSPFGDKISFTSNRSGNYDIWIIDVSGLVNIESASLGEIKAHYATDEMKGK